MVIPIEVVGPPTVIAAVGQGDIDGRDDDGGEVDIIRQLRCEALEGDDPADVDGYMYRDVDAKKVR